MSITFDLSTLGLADGTYSITATAKGVKLKTSVHSGAVSYVVEPSTVTIPSGTYVTSTSAYDFAYDASVAWGTEQVLAFTSNGVSYNTMKTAQGLELYYDSTRVIIFDGDSFSSSWTNDNYKTVKLDTDQEVSEAFGTWFNANFEKQPDTVTIEAGTYVANSNFSTSTALTEGTEYNINFTSNNTSFTYIHFIAVFGLDMYYGNTMIYYAHTDDGFDWEYRWVNSNYKTVNISARQTVTPEFGAWFNSNFTRQAGQVPV